MISPDDLRQKALNLWESQRFLRAKMEGATLFPWDIPFSKPTSEELSDRFTEVRDWLRQLQLQSKETRGYGYCVEYRVVNHRRLGNQSLPKRIYIDSVEDFLRLTNKEKEFARFEMLSSKILAEWPQLRPLITHNPMMVLDHHARWDRLLAVCLYFVDHPRPAIYMRQLDIPGVDTKFIETNIGVLTDLLNIIAPNPLQDAVPSLADQRFERRFNLRYEEPSVRFRLLDSSLSLSGLTDLSVPISEFQHLAVPIQRVFIIENKINGLCFPDCQNAMAIFGLGYGVGILSAVDWLKNVAIHYWGDIDTHGFAILDRLRAIFPQTRSFLMDAETLHRFEKLWGREDTSRRFIGQLDHLHSNEQSLFESLRHNAVGDNVRLEQERIAYGYVCRKVAEIISA